MLLAESSPFVSTSTVLNVFVSVVENLPSRSTVKLDKPLLPSVRTPSLVLNDTLLTKLFVVETEPNDKFPAPSVCNTCPFEPSAIPNSVRPTESLAICKLTLTTFALPSILNEPVTSEFVWLKFTVLAVAHLVAVSAYPVTAPSRLATNVATA